MAERNSEYERVEADAYWTPEWVYQALFEAEKFHRASDVAPRERVNGYDFLKDQQNFSEIATNPPYKLATEFAWHSLALTEWCWGKVALLLPVAFDAAKTRRDLFELPSFKRKLVITTRIRWENLPQKANGPSMNHAWYVWDWKHKGPATIGYLPLKREDRICQEDKTGSKQQARLSSIQRRKAF